MAIKKKNIFLRNTIETLKYTSPRNVPMTSNIPDRNPFVHACYIERRLKESYKESLTQKQVAAIRYKQGTYLEFSGKNQYDLAVKSLENRKKGIRLLNVKSDEENKSIKATVYIPSGEEAYFIDKVQAYAKKTSEGKKPANNDLVSSIENVKLAMVESFWIGDKQQIPSDVATWCEVWLRYTQNELNKAENDFEKCCSELHIDINPNHIIFPERVVKLVKVNLIHLKGLIGSCAFIAEFRRAPESTCFFDELSGSEQKDWCDDLLSRTNFLNSNITICLLDTGVSSEHPLLAPAMREENVQSVESSWGVKDYEGHGTEMAGIALYNDVQKRLEEQSEDNIVHGIESVKILPPRGANLPELYGAITERAVALAEISNPVAKRILCMAVTSPEYNTKDGSPTSWSAAIDNITSGTDDGEEKRLFIVSAGNVNPTEFYQLPYLDANIMHSIESPGQSWNAVTAGAFAQEIEISSSGAAGYKAIADVGELSPYSSTSVSWDKKWPIKPEILLDGGNAITDGYHFFSCSDLALLTTHSKPVEKLFTTIWGTSSATAQAAWMAAQIFAEYPDIWPETVRGLMVHSARWTDKMRRQFCQEDTKSKGRRILLRSCGYGIPDLNRAIQCMSNSVNLIIQGELQPFEKADKIRMKDMHFHKIPWPSDILKSLGEVEVEMRVTLSYFIEPGPGEIGWKDKYRYPSCGLRFDVINTDESIDDFKKRVNKEMRGEDKKDKGEGSSGSSRWYLGSDNRDVGSIHSDFYQGNAIDLCEANYVAVYPVSGWWRERSYLGKCNNKMRYSLIVSLSTPDINVDLYTPIVSQIQAEVQVEVLRS